MKSIYILLTRSCSIVSRIIGLCTADSYTHVSISFKKNLSPLYSFARKQPSRPLPAGLCEEDLGGGFFKIFSATPCALYELKVSDEVFEKAKCEVNRMMAEAEVYRFNIIGLFLCRFNIPYKRKRHYFCSQFVSEILTKANALELPKHTSLMRPNDYSKMPQLICLYVGAVGDLNRICLEKTLQMSVTLPSVDSRYNSA